MTPSEELVDIILNSIKDCKEELESSDYLQFHFILQFDLPKEFARIQVFTRSLKQISDIYIELDNVDTREKNFKTNLILELKRIAFLNLAVSFELVDISKNEILFQTKSCKTFKEKVLEIQSQSNREVFEVKFNKQGCEAEIYFFHNCGSDRFLNQYLKPERHQLLTSSMLFCGMDNNGYYNPEATGNLLSGILRFGEAAECIGFIGSLSDDFNVYSCVKEALRQVDKKLKKVLKDFANTTKMNWMTRDEIFLEFFSETRKKENESCFGFSGRNLRRRNVESKVDLTEDDSDNESGVSSEMFFDFCCSDGEVIEDVGRNFEADEDLRSSMVNSVLFKQPMDPKLFDRWMPDPEMEVEADDFEVQLKKLEKESKIVPGTSKSQNIDFEPVLGRGVDRDKPIPLPGARKSRLLDPEDFGNPSIKKNYEAVTKTKISFSSQDSSFRIPKKSARSPAREPSPSILQKSPINPSYNFIKRRPPIHNTDIFSKPRDEMNPRAKVMLERVLKTIAPSSSRQKSPIRFVNSTPSSISSFIDGGKPEEDETINLVEDEDVILVEDEKNIQKPKRKLLGTSENTPKDYKIFTAKNRNRPNFENFDGSFNFGR